MQRYTHTKTNNEIKIILFSGCGTVSSFCCSGFKTPTQKPQRTSDNSEQRLSEFLSSGCGCSKQCYKMFVVGHYQDVRDQCAELSRDELDHVLLGQIMANMNITTIVGPKSKHSPTVRKRPGVTYSHQGQSICKLTFLVLHGIGKFIIFIIILVQYKLSCEEAGLRAAAYNTFCTLWRQLTPHITVMKPMMTCAGCVSKTLVQ